MTPKKSRLTPFSFIYVTADSLAVIGAFLFSYYLRFSSHWFEVTHHPAFRSYLKALAVSVPIFLALFRYFKLYSPRPARRSDILHRSFYAVTTGFILFMALTFIYRQENFFYSRLFMVLCWLSVFIFFNAFRILVNKAEKRYIKASGMETAIVLLGINKTARRLIHWLKQAKYSGYRVKGIYSVLSGEKGGHIENCEILGSLRDFERDMEWLEADEVILTEPSLERETIARLMLLAESRMMEFRVVTDLYGMVTSSVEIEQMNSIPVMGLRPLPLDDLWHRIVKRGFDLAGSALGLILTSPLFLLAALAIKLEDRGPVFYAQERVTKGGRVFRLLKFRTMMPNAEKSSGPVWTSADDERRTRVGQFLRKTNVDELPQLLNVFSGEMSLVGPRPERPYFVERFRNEIPRYMARHKIRAGITGWAQVNGYRGDATVQVTGAERYRMGLPDYTPYQFKEEQQFLVERIQLDLYYVENWSLLFDMEILFKTLFAFKNAF